jgi:drug/metabolite transporter (DMT)-like permease
MWFFLAITSVFSLAAAELFQQHILHFKKSFNERTSGILTFFTQAVLAAPIVLLVPSIRADLFKIFEPGILPSAIAVALLGSVIMIFYLRSFKVQNISFSQIFFSLSVIVSTTLGIILFKESISALKLLGIFLILAAIIAANFKNAALEKNHLWALIAGGLLGFSYTIDKSIVLHLSPLIYIFWTFPLLALFGFIFSPRAVVNDLKGKGINDYKTILFSALGYFFYNVLTFFAYTIGGEVGKIDAINNTQVFLVILFEIFILRHTDGVWRKILAAGVAYAGVVILGIYK